MAKRKVTRKKSSSTTTKQAKVKLTPRDRKTLNSLRGLADGVVNAARRRRDPHVDIPSRTLSNVRYSPRKRIIEMGKNTNRRQLFNLSQAKSYMQTMLVASGCKKLIEQNKTTSIRGLYYLLKHTIEGTKEETFDDQGECDSSDGTGSADRSRRGWRVSGCQESDGHQDGCPDDQNERSPERVGNPVPYLQQSNNQSQFAVHPAPRYCPSSFHPAQSLDFCAATIQSATCGGQPVAGRVNRRFGHGWTGVVLLAAVVDRGRLQGVPMPKTWS